ncbi:hypothetical protein HPOKI422_06225 [Helicobacter pylori oki422]|nr:hypothetical protein HPOKI422_06225 [Helicobacter pylori oki422]
MCLLIKSSLFKKKGGGVKLLKNLKIFKKIVIKPKK